jgi:uncharacterized membrane protein YgcG
MKKYFNLVVALVAMLFAGNSFAYNPPPAPAQGWYVVDQTGKLSEAQKTALNLKIDQVSKTTKNEFGILLLNTMDGDNIEDVAYTTFNTWGIGKRGLDNGVLIVVSLQERKSRIETGKGVGGEVTDLQSKQILDNTLRPFLKKGDFAGGFNATLDALSSLIESRHNQKAAPVDTTASHVSNDTSAVSNAPAGCAFAAAGVGATDSGSSGVGWLVFALLGGGFVVWRLRASAKRRAADRQAALDVEELRQNRLEAQRRESERRAAQRAETERLENANRLERERVAREIVRPRVYPPVSTTLGAPPIAPPSPRATVKPAAVVAAAATGVTAGVIAAEAERRLKAKEREEAQAKAEREEESRRRRQRDEDDRKRRERDEEDRRRRQREDDDRRSSSSSSSFDFGGGSSSGGGFDGGSSGGGGASSDW